MGSLNLNIEVVRYTKSHERLWNDFVSETNTHFFFNRAYMEYHKDRFQDHSLLFFSGPKIIGLLPANEDSQSQTIWSHQGLTYGGFIWRPRISLIDALDCSTALLQYLKNQGFSRLVYKALPELYCETPSQEAMYCLHRLEAKVVRCEPNTVIDLSRGLHMTSGKKYGANVARKAGVRIECVRDLDQFYAVLAERLAERYSVRPVHSASEIRLLAELFPDNVRLIGSYLNNDLIAGAVVFLNTRVLHIQYLTTSQTGRKLRALDHLVIDGIIPLAKTQRFVSFGISSENGGAVLNEGLLKQKEEYGGQTFVHLTFEVSV